MPEMVRSPDSFDRLVEGNVGMKVRFLLGTPGTACKGCPATMRSGCSIAWSIRRLVSSSVFVDYDEV